MDNKLWQAVKVGIKFGILIVLIYLVIGFTGQWLSNTPAYEIIYG